MTVISWTPTTTDIVGSWDGIITLTCDMEKCKFRVDMIYPEFTVRVVSNLVLHISYVHVLCTLTCFLQHFLGSSSSWSQKAGWKRALPTLPYSPHLLPSNHGLIGGTAQVSPLYPFPVRIMSVAGRLKAALSSSSCLTVFGVGFK